MNKETIINLVNAYKWKALDQMRELAKAEARSLLPKHTLAELETALERVRALCAVLKTEAEGLCTTKGKALNTHAFELFGGYNGGLPANGIVEKALNNLANDLVVKDTERMREAARIGSRFDSVKKALQSARSAKTIREILAKIGLGEIAVDDDTAGGIDYEAVQEIITTLKALPAPIEKGE